MVDFAACRVRGPSLQIFVFRFVSHWGGLVVCYHVIWIYSILVFIYEKLALADGGYGGEWVGLPNQSRIACSSPFPPAFTTWFYSRSHPLQNIHRSHVGSSNFSRSVEIPAVHEPPCWSARPLFLNETSELKESFVFFSLVCMGQDRKPSSFGPR